MKLLEFLDTIREDDSSESGKFVGAKLTRDSERKLMHWMRENGLRKKEPRANLHITVVLDKNKDFDWNPAVFEPPLEIDAGSYKLERFGKDDDTVVLSFSCSELEHRHEKAIKDHGIHWDHPTYQPHITLSKDPKELNDLERTLLPTFPLYIEKEYTEPFQKEENNATNS